MPVFNGAEWLRSAAASILSQTHQNLELIISDNASVDATQAIAEQLAESDSRVRYYRKERNDGATANYNAVLHHATGEYFKWTSCNDYCKPELLQRCLDVLESDKSVVLAFPRTSLFEREIDDAVPYEDDLHLTWDDPYRRFTEFQQRVRLNNVMNGVIRRRTLLKTALMRPYFASDTCLMAELTLHGKFFEVPENLFYRRMDVKSATKLKSSVERIRHWNPDLRPVHYSVTRSVAQTYGALFRAPLSIRTRGRLCAYLVRKAIWSRQSIWGETVESIGHFFGLSRKNNNE